MPNARVYDLLYRFWAPWDSVGVREDLVALLASGRVSADTHPRAIDLGCGTGANVVHLAREGFTPTGVDFSGVALDQARRRARAAGVSAACRFVRADLTDPRLPRWLGSFDLLLDFGTLDDLGDDDRVAAAHNIGELAHPGAVMLLYCFYAHTEDLPIFSISGPSKLYPGLRPGEPERLFGAWFEIQPFRDEEWTEHTGCFLLTGRDG